MPRQPTHGAARCGVRNPGSCAGVRAAGQVYHALVIIACRTHVAGALSRCTCVRHLRPGVHRARLPQSKQQAASIGCAVPTSTPRHCMLASGCCTDCQQQPLPYNARSLLARHRLTNIFASYDADTDTWSRGYRQLPVAMKQVQAQLVQRPTVQGGRRTTLLVVGGEHAVGEDGIGSLDVSSRGRAGWGGGRSGRGA